MHPHIQTWGSILRLYGSKMDDSLLNSENESSETKKPDGKENNSNGNSSQGVDTHAHHKAKPNKELLEKLKEEMRKLKKQQDQPSTEKNPNFDLMNKDTLLTIPPLLLGDKEFKFSSANYLMVTSKTGESGEVEADGESKASSSKQEDIIVFSSSCINNKFDDCGREKRPLESEDSSCKRKRRDSRSDGELDSESDDSNSNKSSNISDESDTSESGLSSSERD
jgi:hypothetical protein